MKHFPTDFQSQTPTPNHVFAAADNNGTACKFSLFNLWSYIKTTYIDSLLAGKAASSHTHDQSDITGLSSALAGKAASSHTHDQSDITGLSTALAGKMDAKTIDSTPTASSTNLVTSGGVKAALDGKAASSHTHAKSEVTGLTTALDGKLNNDALTVFTETSPVDLSAPKFPSNRMFYIEYINTSASTKSLYSLFNISNIQGTASIKFNTEDVTVPADDGRFFVRVYKWVNSTFTIVYVLFDGLMVSPE